MTDTRQLETSFLNTMSLVLDELVRGRSVQVESLVETLDQMSHRATIAGFHQTASHMSHFKDVVANSASRRAQADFSQDH